MYRIRICVISALFSLLALTAGILAAEEQAQAAGTVIEPKIFKVTPAVEPSAAQVPTPGVQTAARDVQVSSCNDARMRQQEARARYAAGRAAYWEQRRLEKAEQELERAMKKRMKCKIGVLYKTACVFYKTEQYELAQTAFSEILALDPENLLAKEYLKKIKVRIPEYEYKQRIKDCERRRDERVTLSH